MVPFPCRAMQNQPAFNQFPGIQRQLRSEARKAPPSFQTLPAARMDPYAFASRGSLHRPCAFLVNLQKTAFSARFVLLFLVQ
jgi:hypothetical protein